MYMSIKNITLLIYIVFTGHVFTYICFHDADVSVVTIVDEMPSS